MRLNAELLKSNTVNRRRQERLQGHFGETLTDRVISRMRTNSSTAFNTAQCAMT